jgi:hypothetical protein
MSDETPNRWEAMIRNQPMSVYTQAQAVSLTMVINALIGRVGAQETAHMLLAGAVAVTNQHLTREHAITWLRQMADTLEQEPDERAN